ncbi:glutamate [NMDA] receptor subunit 1 [Eurytemora carolleeae]|uniref:glutamate [NMDA] receptor subunit 1 n=1 Tax=Eurytemora carolleeae TaxID=1294199 RepID=UPI000C76DA2F|nr:glutamate [NMDA] receptor subunit 1 [Eurytemora carolleeae]|eukprot:XP_023339788.1 glutamate [NMDA] receptor subunit 1-like [Eurytemora affinis]
MVSRTLVSLPLHLPPLPFILLLFLPTNPGSSAINKPKTLYIGGVLSTTATAQAFTMEAQHIDYQHLYLPENVSLYDSTQIMDSNPIKTAIIVCNKLIKERVSYTNSLIKSSLFFTG